MFSVRRFLSRCLLAVMLATVFSPSFGWELVGGMGAGQAVVQGADEPPCHHAAPPEDEGCAGCPEHASPGGEWLHHCCPGHVLGHLPASFPSFPVLGLVSAAERLPAGVATRFTSHVPEGLERPPRCAA